MVILATRPNPYPAAAGLIRGLPQAMRADRERNTLTVTAQAKLVGVGADTLMRLDAGSNPTQTTLLACCDYLRETVMANLRWYRGDIADPAAAGGTTGTVRRDNTTNAGYGRSNSRTNDSGYGEDMMASYSVTTSKHATLVAATVDTVTITGAAESIEIYNRDATSDIFVRFGTNPTVAGDDSYVVGPKSAITVPSREAKSLSVRLISSGAAAYSVTGIVEA